jgi:hypothetical protein
VELEHSSRSEQVDDTLLLPLLQRKNEHVAAEELEHVGSVAVQEEQRP